ncbi:MAG: hypothetical protein Q8M15_00820 [Bacteroidota bacterium]|nr:hypothetical protein [Bacteroidota bacterium]
MKKLKPTYLLLILFATFSLHNCKKDNNNTKCGGDKYYYYLSEPAKSKVPYSGTDTLVFVSNNHDTAVCMGQGKKQFYVTSSFYANPDCPPNTDYYEAFNYKFIDKNDKLNLEINLYKNDGYVSEVMDMNINSTRLYPINLIYMYEWYYNDSVSTNMRQYKTFKLNFGLGNIVHYNLMKGIIQIQSKINVWTLSEK